MYKVSFVGRSDDKMIYKLVDFGILVFCLFDFMDGKKVIFLIVKIVKWNNSVFLIIFYLWFI